MHFFCASIAVVIEFASQLETVGVLVIFKCITIFMLLTFFHRGG